MATNAGVAAFPAYASSAARERSAVNVLVRLAFYLFVFSIPFELPHRTFPVEIPTITGALFLLFTLLQPSTSYRRIPGAVLWFVTYLWMFGLSTLVSRASQTFLVLQLFLLMLQLVLILWAGFNLLRDRTVLRGVVLTFAVAIALRALLQLLGIGATAREVWTGGVRVTAFGQNPNWSAIVLSAGTITLLSLRPRLITWPLAAITVAAIVQTGSRGGLVALAIGLLIWAWGLGRSTAARIRGLCFGLLGLAVLGVGVMRSDMMRTRLEAAAEEGSLAGRERIYPAVLGMISEKPILGWGPIENQYEIAARIGEEKKDKRDAHNIVFDLMSSTGLLGTVPFFIGLGLCVASGWRARRGPYGIFPFALLMTTLMGCVSGTWIASKVLWLAFAIALATGERATVQRVQRLQEAR
ncbi:MAG TPA: O-antigen ligase family protein [Gemmatimonadales bacterium]|nr:O-antigen ligase family protein [Gemmatimonadales bacterium]